MKALATLDAWTPTHGGNAREVARSDAALARARHGWLMCAWCESPEEWTLEGACARAGIALLEPDETQGGVGWYERLAKVVAVEIAVRAQRHGTWVAPQDLAGEKVRAVHEIAVQVTLERAQRDSATLTLRGPVAYGNDASDWIGDVTVLYDASDPPDEDTVERSLYGAYFKTDAGASQHECEADAREARQIAGHRARWVRRGRGAADEWWVAERVRSHALEEVDPQARMVVTIARGKVEARRRGRAR